MNNSCRHIVEGVPKARLQQILATNDRKAGVFGKMPERASAIGGGGRDPGSDGRSAEVHFQKQALGFDQAVAVFQKRCCECRKFLTKRHRDGVLQLCPTKLSNTAKFFRLVIQSRCKNGKRIPQRGSPVSSTGERPWHRHHSLNETY